MSESKTWTTKQNPIGIVGLAIDPTSLATSGYQYDLVGTTVRTSWFATQTELTNFLTANSGVNKIILDSTLTLTTNWAIPTGFIIEDEGGEITGAHTLTGDDTVLIPTTGIIFNASVTVAGTFVSGNGVYIHGLTYGSGEMGSKNIGNPNNPMVGVYATDASIGSHTSVDTDLDNSVSHIANTSNPHGVTKEQIGVTKLSDLASDSTHRTVTDFEKTTWNATAADGTYQIKTSIFTTPSTINSALTTYGSKTILFDSNVTLTANWTLPEDTKLTFVNDSYITGTYTITGNNTLIEANDKKIFDTNVIFAGTWKAETIYPEWFGIVSYSSPNKTTDNLVAFNKLSSFINICEANEVIFQKGRYYYASSTWLHSPTRGVVFDFNGAYLVTDIQDGMPTTAGTYGLSILGSGATTYTLNDNLTEGSKYVYLTSTSGINVGDGIKIRTGEAYMTYPSAIKTMYTKGAISKVVDIIDSNTVMIAEPLPFDILKSVKGITLSGSSGTLNITINGVTKTATYATSLSQTAENFIEAYRNDYLAVKVLVWKNAGKSTIYYQSTNATTITDPVLSPSGITGTLTSNLNYVSIYTAYPVTIKNFNSYTYPVSIAVNSTTSNTIGSGSKSFTVTGTALPIITGTQVRAYNSANKVMSGTVTSYNSGTGALVMNVVDTYGSGTYTSWSIQGYHSVSNLICQYIFDLTLENCRIQGASTALTVADCYNVSIKDCNISPMSNGDGASGFGRYGATILGVNRLLVSNSKFSAFAHSMAFTNDPCYNVLLTDNSYFESVYGIMGLDSHSSWDVQVDNCTVFGMQVNYGKWVVRNSRLFSKSNGSIWQTRDGAWNGLLDVILENNIITILESSETANPTAILKDGYPPKGDYTNQYTVRNNIIINNSITRTIYSFVTQGRGNATTLKPFVYEGNVFTGNIVQGINMQPYGFIPEWKFGKNIYQSNILGYETKESKVLYDFASNTTVLNTAISGGGTNLTFLVKAKLNPNYSGTKQSIIAVPSGSNKFDFSYTSTSATAGVLKVDYRNAAFTTVTTTFPNYLADTLTHSFALVFSTGNLKMYQDGILMISVDNADFTTIYAPNTFSIGCDLSADYFKGKIDAVAIYGRALTLEEISKWGENSDLLFSNALGSWGSRKTTTVWYDETGTTNLTMTPASHAIMYSNDYSVMNYLMANTISPTTSATRPSGIPANSIWAGTDNHLYWYNGTTDIQLD